MAYRLGQEVRLIQDDPDFNIFEDQLLTVVRIKRSPKTTLYTLRGFQFTTNNVPEENLIKADSLRSYLKQLVYPILEKFY